jgi:hypothetical protein
MQITGASYTAVNRRITEGRRALRTLERDRAQPGHNKQTDRNGELASARAPPFG